MAKDGITSYTGSVRTFGGGLILGDINEGARQVEERNARITLSSAELLALFTTPKTIVEAPGANKVLEFLGAILYHDAGTAYTTAAGRDLAVKYTNAAGATASLALTTVGFMDQATDQMRTLKMLATDIAPVVNAPLVLHQLVANMTVGTGLLYLDVSYRIHETGL